MEIIGPRHLLRYPTAADAPALLALGSDAEVTRFFSWGPYRELDEPLAYIGGLAGERRRGERLDLLIVDRELGPVGIIGLSEFAARDRRAVIGTWLGRAHWGTGANRGAKTLMAKLAFDVLGLERIGAYADLENPRSQVALTTIGFRREGVLRAWHRHGEEVHDVLVYSWLREEWLRSPLGEEPCQILGEPPIPFVVAPQSGVGRGISSAAAPS